MRKLSTWILVLTCLAATVESARAEWRYGLGLQGGAITSSRLYRAAADDRITWRWEQPGGAEDLRGSEVLVETNGLFDGDLANVLQFGVRFTMLSEESPWGGLLTIALSDLDVNAKVRSTRDNVDDVIWDQFFTTQVHAVGTYAFAPGERTPYLLGGLGWVQRSSEGPSLDQGGPAVVLGAGLRFGGGRGWLFDLELRGAWSTLDLDEEDARLEGLIEAQNQVVQPPDTPSDYRFEGEDAALAVEINASWSYVF